MAAVPLTDPGAGTRAHSDPDGRRAAVAGESARRAAISIRDARMRWPICATTEPAVARSRARTSRRLPSLSVNARPP